MEDPLSESHNRLHRLSLLALGAIWLMTALWPGDIPFINDEPRFLYKALRANQRGELEPTGLVGSQGFPYGPLPVWMYQAMLGVSHDLRVVVVLHALLISGLVTLALFWLSTTLHLNLWFAVAILASPYTWFYSRALWDSLNLPLTSLAMASYASFLKRSTGPTLLLTLSCMALMPMVHPMSGAFLLPLAAHMLIFRWRDLLQRWLVVVAVCAGAAITWLPYLRALHLEQGNGMNLSGPDGWWFPLLGARLISASGLGYMFGDNWMSGAGTLVTLILYPAWAISLLAYPLMWCAFIIGAPVIRQVVRRPGNLTLQGHILLLALAVVIVQCILDGALHIYDYPHYYGGTWIVFPLLAWIAWELLSHRVRGTRIIAPVLAISLACITSFMALRIHFNRGLRTLNYGSCLAEEIRVVRQINARGVHGPFLMLSPEGKSIADDPFNFGHDIVLAGIHTNVNSFLRYPSSLNVIQELVDPGPAAAPEGLWLAITTPTSDPISVELKVVQVIPPSRQPAPSERRERQ